ncbi:hypothetical protein [Vulgatibacter sp.]|uniref:hypothetical protein n=1 Tax=Vulgatibacter sp. TaxID=1971226 RepID=UPI003562C541
MSRILVVEDEETLAGTLYELLSEEGYEVPVLIVTSAHPGAVGTHPGAKLLQKPLHLDALLGAVREQLARSDT